MENRLYNSNNRAVINEFGVVRQVTNYYPFGGVFSTTAYNHGDDLQPYKYNGKELDRTHGLDWYDYGARNYDAIVPMFTSLDPLCEKYYHISPYAYCANNPVLLIDPDGRYFDFSNCSQDFIDAFMSIVRELQKCGDKDIMKFYNELEQDKERAVIVIPTDLDAAGTGHSDDGEKKGVGMLWFDPYMFAQPENGEGNIMSPATILNHELFHVWSGIYGEKKDNDDSRYFDPIFGTTEDRDLIEVVKDADGNEVKVGLEQRTARALGEISKNEVTRTSGGKLIYYKADRIARDPITNKYKIIK